MSQRTRFVLSGPGPLERVLDDAHRRRFTRVDFNADTPENYPDRFDASRRRAVKARCRDLGITLGIHTLSAINMAEMTPVMHAAIDRYLLSNFDLAVDLGAGYAICHGGYHFGGDRAARLATAVDRMRRAVAWADERGIDIYFENHNKEPDEAEPHYLPRDVAETREFLDVIDHPRFRWACNVGHAHLAPDGFDGFFQAFGVARIGQVRLNDTHGRYEEHLIPGQGIVDFKRVFRMLSGAGYRGPFTLDFGTADDKTRWRDTFAEWLSEIEGP